MRATQAFIDQTGGPEVIQWRELELPAPGPGEVLLRHEAVGLNYIDTYQRSGLYPMRLPGPLGFEAAGESGGRFSFKVPSWRIDVEQEEDLVEEVARHTGYEKIKSELPPASASGEYQPSEMKQRSLRRALNAFGFDEAINFSFIEQEARVDLVPSLSGYEGDQPQLANPIIEDAAWMRSTLLPGLLNSLRSD